MDLEPINDFRIGPGMKYIKFVPTTTWHHNITPPGALSICLDGGSRVSLVGRDTLEKWFPDISIKHMTEGALRLSGIGGKTVAGDWVTLSLRLRSSTGQLVRVAGEFHVLPELEPHIIVGNDMLHAYGVVIDSGRSTSS